MQNFLNVKFLLILVQMFVGVSGSYCPHHLGEEHLKHWSREAKLWNWHC